MIKCWKMNKTSTLRGWFAWDDRFVLKSNSATVLSISWFSAQVSAIPACLPWSWLASTDSSASVVRRFHPFNYSEPLIDRKSAWNRFVNRKRTADGGDFSNRKHEFYFSFLLCAIFFALKNEKEEFSCDLRLIAKNKKMFPFAFFQTSRSLFSSSWMWISSSTAFEFSFLDLRRLIWRHGPL